VFVLRGKNETHRVVTPFTFTTVRLHDVFQVIHGKETLSVLYYV